MERIQKAKIEGAKVRAAGNGYAFFIPKALVDTDVIEGGKEYEVIISEVRTTKKENLNNEAKAIGKAGTKAGLELSLVRASVQETAFSGGKEVYLSGKVPVLIGDESWAEQFALGFPNRNFEHDTGR
jgi:hypothetical protein